MFEFRWLTRFALALGLVGALVAAPSVGGSHLVNRAEATSVQSVTGTWVSAITVLNPSTSPGSADVTVSFYDPSGTAITAATQTQLGLLPGNTASWYVPNIVGLTANQTYSAVVSASQQVYATVNLSSLAPTTMGETYNGVDTTQVATTGSAPAVYRNYYGFTSNLVVQNTGSSSTTATVSFTGNNGVNNVVVSSPSPIAPNAAYTFDLNNYSQLGTGFNGAATVNGGNSAVAVIANNYTPSPKQTGATSNITGYLFSSANATTPASGATTSFVPALYNFYYGFYTSLTVENVDTVPTNVTVSYFGGGISNITDSCLNLAPNASCLFYTPSAGTKSVPATSLPASWQGSATVTSSGQKIVAVVNESGTSSPTSPGGLATYNGFSTGFLSVFAPGLLSNYHGFSSSLTIQNVDTVTAPAGSVSVLYSNVSLPAHILPALAPGQSFLIYLPNDGLPTNYNGGATVTSTTAKIVGVENISGAPESDELFSTNAFGQ